MNKYQEALGNFWKHQKEGCRLYHSRDVLQQLIDKATPKKLNNPVYQNPYVSHGECPSCNETIYATPHCYNCGQAISTGKSND